MAVTEGSAPVSDPGRPRAQAAAAPVSDYLAAALALGPGPGGYAGPPQPDADPDAVRPFTPDSDDDGGRVNAGSCAARRAHTARAGPDTDRDQDPVPPPGSPPAGSDTEDSDCDSDSSGSGPCLYTVEDRCRLPGSASFL